MVDNAAVSVHLTYSDPDLDDEEREQLAQQLHHQLCAADSDLGTWRRVEAAPPPGSKSVAAQVVGALAAVLSAASLKSFFAYLGERWRGREISLELEVNGKKIKIVAHSQEDLLARILHGARAPPRPPRPHPPGQALLFPC